jgi:hypothetical protein
MTKIEWNCRLAWIEAAITWYLDEAQKYSAQAHVSDELHHAACYEWSRAA